MLRIALTGGIGTGKTYLARIFSSMQFPVYNADKKAKDFYQNPDVKAKLKEVFGEKVFSGPDLDLGKISRLIFSDINSLNILNGIIHPLVIDDFELWAISMNSEVVIMESAIVYEAGLDRCFDLILVADSPLEIRMKRLKARDPHLSEKEIHQRIGMQMEQTEKCSLADIIVINDRDDEQYLSYRIPLK